MVQIVIELYDFNNKKSQRNLTIVCEKAYLISRNRRN